MLKLFRRTDRPNWLIKGNYLGREICKTTRTKNREEAEKILLELQERLSKGDGLVWKQIPGFSRYEISDNGQVRRLPALLKQTRSRSGHLNVSLYSDDGKQWRAGVHHFVAWAFLGEPPQGKPCACHKNGIPHENSPQNLYWGSHVENAADAARHGFTSRFMGKSRALPKQDLTELEKRRKKAFRPNWLETRGE